MLIKCTSAQLLRRSYRNSFLKHNYTFRTLVAQSRKRRLTSNGSISKPKPVRDQSTRLSDGDLSAQSADLTGEISLLLSRIVAAFGILHVVTEYGVDLTRCEGPSMMPTVRPVGEIIVIEKITHRLGIEGGNDGEVRAKNAKEKQKAWEAKEHKEFLARSSSKKRDVYSPSWYRQKLPQVNAHNYTWLSSFTQQFSRFTTGIDVGDVVVLEHPDREGTVCKRVLGLPGDCILRPKHNSFYSSEHRDVMGIFEERDEREGQGHRSKLASLSDSSLQIVPDGHIWVEGDNSINSADSRNYGPVPSALVVGKVWFRIWPLRGFAQMVRGSRPMPPNHAPFTGSTVIPAGCEGEEITTIET